ncbi:MAG: DUF1957 domain-containing protein, partial [Candidatus Kapabacteria bacterium]|nr:DUF1957 domain-containing protein [Candidatus Kapabacteria bacterium]
DISPVLCEQLSHPDFPSVFERYCEEHGELARVDRSHMEQEGAPDEIMHLTDVWEKWYATCWADFSGPYNSDIVGQFKRLQDAGAIEIMTCGVTHGYLPLIAEDASVDLQVELAVRSYVHRFGRRPRGIWLPECAYRPSYPWRTLLQVSSYAVARKRDGVEQVLARHGLDFFVTDEGALDGAKPIGVRGPDGARTSYEESYGVAREILDEKSVFDLFRVSATDHGESAAIFTRHMQIALQVWSGESGYPGDPDYLDFHKKYFRSALRYWRVTDVKGDMGMKQPYVPEWAENKAKSHALHFLNILEVALKHRMATTDRLPTLCLPFDTELFGHWWFEGPAFLENVLRGIHASPFLSTTTASEQLDKVLPACEIALPESSWGKNGNDSVWMNPENQWTWEKEYQLERRMRLLFEKHPVRTWDATMRRIAKNAIRQLLLLQASDWQFLISTFSAKEYAEMRFHNHLEDARRLCDLVERYGVSRKLELNEYFDQHGN